MPYVPNDPNDPSNPNNPNNPLYQQGPGGGLMLGSGSGFAGATPSAQPKQSSSGWTNLRSYLDANQDQSMGLANQVSGNIQSQGNAARGAIDQNIGAYNSQVQGARGPQNTDALISQANTDPAAFAADPNNVSQWNQMRSGVFNGPDIFENQSGYGALQQQVGNAGDLASGANTEGGRRNLVQNLAPTRGQGQIDLDELLVSGNPQAQKQIVDAAQPYTGLKGYLNTQMQSADTARNKAVSDLSNNSQKVQDQFVAPQTKNLQDLENQITGRVNQFGGQQATQDQAIQDLQGAVAGRNALSTNENSMFFPNGVPDLGYNEKSMRDYLGNLYDTGQISSPLGRDYAVNLFTDEATGRKQPPNPAPPSEGQLLNTLQAMRLNPISYLQQNASNVPNWLNKYFPGTTPSQGAASSATVASKDEAAKILALQQLTGSQTPFLTQDQLAQAGTYTPARIGKWAGL